MTPTSPPSLCNEPGCAALVTTSRCEKHRHETNRDNDTRRPNSTQRGYNTTAWRNTRLAYLRTHPLCECNECQTLPPAHRPIALDVDHIDGQGPHGPRGLDHTNLQALSHAHHSRKTARYDGGFGNRTRTASSPD